MQGPQWTPAQRAARLTKLVERNRSRRESFLYEDRAWMTDAYVRRGLTMRAMANEARCGLRTIARWMTTHGIETRKEWPHPTGPRHHNWTGAQICPECAGPKNVAARKCAACADRNKTGEENPHWRGDDVEYAAVHGRLVRHRGKASAHECQHCTRRAREWAYDHDDPAERRNQTGRDDGPYSLDPNHYMPLCTKCHRKFDLGKPR